MGIDIRVRPRPVIESESHVAARRLDLDPVQAGRRPAAGDRRHGPAGVLDERHGRIGHRAERATGEACIDTDRRAEQVQDVVDLVDADLDEHARLRSTHSTVPAVGAHGRPASVGEVGVGETRRATLAGLEPTLGRSMPGQPAWMVSHTDHRPGRRGTEQLQALLEIDGDRLVHERRFACVDGCQRHVCVEVVRRGDDDRLHLRVREQRLEAARRPGDRELGGERAPPVVVATEAGDDVHGIGPPCGRGVDARPAAEADEADSDAHTSNGRRNRSALWQSTATRSSSVSTETASTAPTGSSLAMSKG